MNIQYIDAEDAVVVAKLHNNDGGLVEIALVRPSIEEARHWHGALWSAIVKAVKQRRAGMMRERQELVSTKATMLQQIKEIDARIAAIDGG